MRASTRTKTRRRTRASKKSLPTRAITARRCFWRCALRTYISEPRRGRQRWGSQEVERDVVYGNRRRIRGDRGQSLMRQRGELIERSFAHTLETGGMRRTHLRGHENIAKRTLLHVAGFNLGLLMRKRFGVGKPRCLQGRSAALWAAFLMLLDRLVGSLGLSEPSMRRFRRRGAVIRCPRPLPGPQAVVAAHFLSPRAASPPQASVAAIPSRPPATVPARPTLPLSRGTQQRLR